MRQATLDLAVASAAGERAAEACLAKAERAADFDTQKARSWIVDWLTKHGPTTGEDLVDGLKIAGICGHDDRCTGGVFKALARANKIAKYGTAPRRKGHGTAGATVWRIVRG